MAYGDPPLSGWFGTTYTSASPATWYSDNTTIVQPLRMSSLQVMGPPPEPEVSPLEWLDRRVGEICEQAFAGAIA